MDVDAYGRDGILASYAVLSGAGIDGVLDTIAATDAQPAPLRRSLLMHKGHLISACLAAICTSPAILGRVEALISPDILPPASTAPAA